jgi:tRNA(Ile)-lysidine synthase TilS/MesJ
MGLYSRVCQETGARGVMLAHHLDDAIENVISNVIFPRPESSIFDAG